MSRRQCLNVGRWVVAGLAVAGPRFARKPARLALAASWLWPTLRQNCPWHGPVLTSLKDFPGVWLTLDDGPDPRSTPEFLAVLKAFNAKASFFAIGRRVRALPGLARRILDEGHTLENHTLTHPAATWWLTGPRRTAREIREGARAILETTGFSPRFFRAPAGMINPWVHCALGGMKLAGWSAAARDACPDAPGRVASRLLSAVRPGAILVLHEGAGARHRARALELTLDGLRRAGLACDLPAPGLPAAE